MSIDWKHVATKAILADGTIDEAEVKILQGGLKDADGKYGTDALAYLMELRKKAKTKSAAFDKFFFKAIESHVVRDGKITSAGAGYLKETLFPGARVDDAGYGFLTSLNKKAKDKAPEFTAFMAEVDKKRAKTAGKK
jgi:hypothetical protein